MSEQTENSGYVTDPDLWLDDLVVYQEDHVFAAPTEHDDALRDLQAQLAAAVRDLDAAVQLEGGGISAERAADEEPESARLQAQIDDINAQISQVADERNAARGEGMRVRLRGLTADDLAAIENESDKARAAGDRGLDVREQTLRQVRAAFVHPELTLDQARRLRQRLNSAEWARLIYHITALTNRAVAEVDLPN